MENIKINYATFTLTDTTKKGVIAVLMYSGSGDPKIALDNAVSGITKNVSYFELIDAHLDNPWTRVVITHINDITQVTLDLNEHKLEDLAKK